MKAVMIGIQPKWVEKIASGEKTIEVRKTRPKIDTPFKCYIYCTKAKSKAEMLSPMPFVGGVELGECLDKYRIDGKVIGEFVCNNIIQWNYFEKLIILGGITSTYMPFTDDLKSTCLSYDEFANYGKGKTLYGWRISDLVIYEQPKELSEFWAYNAELNKLFNEGEDCCAWGRCETESGCTNDCDTENILNCYQCWADWNGWCHRLTRPPESWRYVEEKEKDNETN